MSYRPDNQALEPHIDKITEGIMGFKRATIERISNNEWKNEHIKELVDICDKLAQIDLKLIILKTETW